ncbi:MAG: class I SAM-dependent methyltransferase [Gammaproteobacteria bacterium]|nr:class I SAM-dependent methyltransferase [Gammaproteobacteria bacterium]
MWDQRYSEPGYAYGTDANEFLKQHYAAIPAGGRVLCLAEGQGRNAVFLAQHGYDVTAVDASSIGLQCARTLAAQRGVEIATVVADLADFPLEPRAWHGIVSIFCHLPPPARIRLHAQIAQALVPGGVMILEAYTPAQLRLKSGGPPLAEMMMTAQTLRDELAGLDFVQLRELEREVVEGKYHTGRGAVVQLLGSRR